MNAMYPSHVRERSAERLGTERHRTNVQHPIDPVLRERRASRLPAIVRLATTVSTWWPKIPTGVTNAGSLGTSRVIKADARDPDQTPRAGESGSPRHELTI
jgi:hypothetical protein